jgi:C4-type Zn-finger protein
MKTLFFTLILIASSAIADVKEPGTFVARMCGHNPSGQICFGDRVGIKGSYVSVAVQRARQVVYAVVRKTSLDGINVRVDHLELRSEDGRVATATVSNVSGRITSVTAKLQNGNEVTVNNVQLIHTSL